MIYSRGKHFLLFSQCFLSYMALIFHSKCTIKCPLQFVSIWTSLKFCRLVIGYFDEHYQVLVFFLFHDLLNLPVYYRLRSVLKMLLLPYLRKEISHKLFISCLKLFTLTKRAMHLQKGLNPLPHNDTF